MAKHHTSPLAPPTLLGRPRFSVNPPKCVETSPAVFSHGSDCLLTSLRFFNRCLHVRPQHGSTTTTHFVFLARHSTHSASISRFLSRCLLLSRKEKIRQRVLNYSGSTANSVLLFCFSNSLHSPQQHVTRPTRTHRSSPLE